MPTNSHLVQSTVITPELGEVFMFSGVPDEGEGQLIPLYSAKDFGDPPNNDQRFTGDGS